MYAAPVLVSDIVAARADTATDFDVAAREETDALRGFCVVAVRVAVVRDVVIGNVPARVFTVVFCVRVGAAARAESELERNTVVVRDCGAEGVRAIVDKDVPSRTADTADAQAKTPRKAPKIRIFFISDRILAKFVIIGQEKK